ncbi:MAG: toprim domain-containing protein [Dechloromonas sp.]|nr:toprim domain-containing protein [Dechloromonas sp.]
MAFSDDLRRLIDRLKETIDLHDLADKLGLERPGGAMGNYRSPGHKDSSPSLSIFPAKFGTAFKDHSDPDKRGDCVALYQYVHGGDAVAAVKALCELYAIPYDIGREQSAEPRREKSTAEYIAEKCLAAPLAAKQYLVEKRGILDWVADKAIQARAVGWNDWRSTKVPEGTPGHGGPAVAFIVKTLNPGHVMAVDMRYDDPALNGGVKTQCQGEKDGYGWTSDIRRLKAARTVYVVESPINALSLECVIRQDEAAYAIRGVGNVDNIDWSWARGKQVVIVFDNDEPFPEYRDDGKRHPQAGIRPGLKAAWALHERLTALDISALLVDQGDWEVNDCNDFIKPGGPGMEKLKRAVRKLEQCAIPGLAWNYEDMFGPLAGKRRLYLPFHHDQKYWRYRVRPDFTSYVSKIEKDDEDAMPKIDLKEVAGFRIAAISRLELQGARSTLTGDPDQQPTTRYSVSVQTTRGGPKLIRKVFDDENLHNIERWKRLGPVWDQSNFLRLVNILECACDIGSRRAVNFVGLCWRNGELSMNEGPDCYFEDPQYQCRYHNLIFPSGPASTAKRVIEAFHQTFAENQALLLLTWALSAHLKAFIRFWPHAKMEADKGSGKSTLIGRLSGAIAMASLSGQTLKTEYRMVNSVAFTSHPVCWEEFSRLNDLQRKLALDLLQETYQFQETTRSQKSFLLSAPVLIAGEDAPVDDIAEKLVRFRLNKTKQGDELPFDLPQFPVRQWLEFLADIPADRVRKLQVASRAFLTKSAAVTNAQRIVENYAALLTGWQLMAEFSGLPVEFGGVVRSIVAEMNEYLADSKGERHPWVWILQTLLAEIAQGTYDAPHVFTTIDGEIHLAIRTSDVMHHIRTRPALKSIWEQLPVKSDRVLKRQLVQAGVLAMNDNDAPLDVERTFRTRRVGHMTAISIEKIKEYGLHAVLPAAEDIR